MEIEHKGYLIVIDDDDYSLFLSRSWSFTCGHKYLLHKGLSLHRLIMGIVPGDPRHVDHINGNTLDNRRSNLRFATRNQNLRNQRTRTNDSKTSRFKGVWINKDSGKYRASITVNGSCIKLGTYETQELAATAYNTAAINHFGAFAVLNDI